ncbi:MAG: helix-turn-helix domain-containing protein [Myxococcota bacterium]
MGVKDMAKPSLGREASALSAFGQQLREWRRRRGMTQLDLALSAGSTPRYISFIETGRSRPRRDVVLRLANALDVPVHDRNSMLVAAGLRPEYSAHEYGDEELAPVRNLISSLLTRHEPYPGWCWAPGLRVVDSNAAAERLFPGLRAMSPEEMVDFWYGSEDFRSVVENWKEMLFAGLSVMRREHLVRQDQESTALLERAQRHLIGLQVPAPSEGTPVACPIFLLDGQRVRTMSTFLRFETASDQTVSGLKVELMFPADQSSAGYFEHREVPGARD